MEYVDQEFIGVAKGGWNVTTGSPSFDVGPADPDGTEIPTKLQIVDSAKAKEDIYLSNGVPYIEVLEYGKYPDDSGGSYNRFTREYDVLSEGGFSTQIVSAPDGWVRNATMQWGTIVNEVANRMVK